MSPKDLEKLMKLCRKHGVKALKTSEVSIELDLLTVATIKGQALNTDPSSPTTEGYSQEEILFYSSPDSLQEN